MRKILGSFAVAALVGAFAASAHASHPKPFIPDSIMGDWCASGATVENTIGDEIKDPSLSGQVYTRGVCANQDNDGKLTVELHHWSFVESGKAISCTRNSIRSTHVVRCKIAQTQSFIDAAKKALQEK